MARLSKGQFRATFTAPMLRVGRDEAPPFDFWQYFETIPRDDFGGHDCSIGTVEYVYRDSSNRFEHVLVNSEHRDVFMALVLDRKRRAVLGHHLLNLPALYGGAR